MISTRINVLGGQVARVKNRIGGANRSLTVTELQQWVDDLRQIELDVAELERRTKERVRIQV